MIDSINKIKGNDQIKEFDYTEEVQVEKKETLRPDELLASLKEKALLLNHLRGKEPTNAEVEVIRVDLEKMIKELEALNV